MSRTHRQRTQAYIKELEKEVLRLRTCKSNALARVDQLEERVETLLNTLAKHSIPAPPEIPHPATDASVGHVVVGTEEDPSAVHVSLSFPPAAGQPMELVHHPVQPSHSASRPGPLMNPGAGFLSENMQQTLLTDPRVGIDFILAYALPICFLTHPLHPKASATLRVISRLERPCLDHLRLSHLDYDDRAESPDDRARCTSHHIFTASLQLWNPSLRSRSAQESYDISATEIERLLNTSLNIGVSDDEITPVQIWHHLKNFSLPEERQKEFLNKITGELCKLVECIQ